MITFLQYLKEEEGEKLKHITHAEDRPLQTGKEGFEHAVGALNQAHNHIKSGGHSSALTMKYDGSPSVVFGHHPETGKFFVASKSAFNVNPKINHTEKDIEKNHGHAPGLVSKLKDSLKHLKKIAPKTGVYQGDLMYSGDDKKEEKGGKVSFTPNTIKYTAKGDLADKIRKSKLGVIVHTQYHGDDLRSMKADSHPDLHNFNQHPDVWTRSADHDTKQIHYSEADQKEFQHHMDQAKKLHDKHGEKMYDATEPHRTAGHLETYINHTVRTDEKPSAEGFKKYIGGRYQTAIEKMKSEAGKKKKQDEASKHMEHIDTNKKHYDNLLKMHNHLQQAKDVLVRNLNQHEGGLEHHIGSKRTDPEGFVVNHAGQPTKLVNRKEFSKANLLKVRL